MSSRVILNEDWSDYDNRKKKKEDRLFFSCEEDWEVKYLLEKIHRHFSNVSEDKIYVAIMSCCKTVPAPRPRKTFVECVMNGLGLEDNGGGGNPPPKPGTGPKNPPTPPGNRKVG